MIGAAVVGRVTWKHPVAALVLLGAVAVGLWLGSRSGGEDRAEARRLVARLRGDGQADDDTAEDGTAEGEPG